MVDLLEPVAAIVPVVHALCAGQLQPLGGPGVVRIRPLGDFGVAGRERVGRDA